jgi:hypothetical protein
VRDKPDRTGGGAARRFKGRAVQAPHTDWGDSTCDHQRDRPGSHCPPASSALPAHHQRPKAIVAKS